MNAVQMKAKAEFYGQRLAYPQKWMEDNEFVPKHAHDHVNGDIPFHMKIAIQSQKPLVIGGEMGYGKSSIVESIAHKMSIPLLELACEGGLRPSDILGSNRIIDGQTVFQYGILPLAMKKGYWLLLDDVSNLDPGLSSIFFSVLTDRTLTIMDNIVEDEGRVGPEVIRAHERFRVFATANAIGKTQATSKIYRGNKKQNKAFLDRFDLVFIEPKFTINELIGTVNFENLNFFNEEHKDFMHRILNLICDVQEDIVSSWEKGELPFPFSIRHAKRFFAKMMFTSDWQNALEVSYSNHMDVKFHDKVKEIFAQHF